MHHPDKLLPFPIESAWPISPLKGCLEALKMAREIGLPDAMWLSPAKPDLLLELAIHELAGSVSDVAKRQAMQQSSADLMRSAVQSITPEPRTG
jgi:hypothetical protein